MLVVVHCNDRALSLFLLGKQWEHLAPVPGSVSETGFMGDRY